MSENEKRNDFNTLKGKIKRKKEKEHERRSRAEEKSDERGQKKSKRKIMSASYVLRDSQFE